MLIHPEIERRSFLANVPRLMSVEVEEKWRKRKRKKKDSKRKRRRNRNIGGETEGRVDAKVLTSNFKIGDKLEKKAHHLFKRNSTHT